MAVKLYSGPLSLFSAKVRIALAEKGVAYEKISVPWSLERRYEPHHPDVVRMNPKAQVPVLVDGDVVVYDSTQILEYLEERAPEPALYPRGLAERARCRRLEAAADEIVLPPVWDLIEEAFYPSRAGGRDEARLARARASLARQYAQLDETIGDGPWLCDTFSVADIATFIFVRAATGIGVGPAKEHRKLWAWFERVLARPAVREDVDAMNRYLAGALAEAKERAAAPLRPARAPRRASGA
jgi:glutathione S-transferase